MLAKHGADPNKAGNNGMTPASLATKYRAKYKQRNALEVLAKVIHTKVLCFKSIIDSKVLLIQKY